MVFKNMQILFDNAWATYNAGSKVAGRLILNLSSPKHVHEIKVKIKGEAQVKWSQRESQTNNEGNRETENVDYTADELYFETKLILIRESNIPPGTHSYDFSTILPPNLPSSYESQFGHIRYTVKVTLNLPKQFNQECKAAFTVISPVDLNFSQEARLPVMVEKEKTVGMCCCASGPLSASITAPYSGFTSGQVIPLTIDVENGTNTNVTEGCVILQKVVTFKSRNPTQRTKIEVTEIAMQSLTQVGAHGSNSWLKQLTVPSLPATSTVGCSIITIAYEIKVKIPVDGICLRGLELTTPIIIGTVPLVSMAPAGGMGGLGGAAAPPIPGHSGQPSAGDNSFYSNLPPPSYEECAFGKANSIQDRDDNEHTMGMGHGWSPHYPSYNFTPSAPPAAQ